MESPLFLYPPELCLPWAGQMEDIWLILQQAFVLTVMLGVANLFSQQLLLFLGINIPGLTATFIGKRFRKKEEEQGQEERGSVA